jgi:hypothetical protein
MSAYEVLAVPWAALFPGVPMEVRLIEAASEIGAGMRGASMGMAALRVAAWKLGSELFGHAEESILRDENDVLYEDDRSPNALNRILRTRCISS